MIFGSVCSGIEAASAAWEPLGWRAAFLSEIEPFPRAVLQHHWPEVPLHGDFTTIQAGDYGPIDLLVGGTPCQSFSVAGLRRGLDADRGNLALEYLRLAGRLRPRWLVWENVPGVLSSGGGRDFGSFLGGLVELGYGWSYRVLDAQYFGVPQRRRRVFVVGYLGDWRPAAAVLFEHHSLQGHSPPRREAGEKIASPIAGGSPRSGGYRNDADTTNGLIAFGDNNTSSPIDVATAVRAKGGTGHGDFESETFVTHTLCGESFDAGEDGTGRGVPLVPIALTVSALGGGWAPRNVDASIDLTNTLDTTRQPGVAVPVYFDARQSDVCVYGDWAAPLDTDGYTRAIAFSSKDYGADAGDQMLQIGSAVRRLTPREAERLQGFPDDFTLIPLTRSQRKAVDAEMAAYYRRTGQDLSNDMLCRLAADGPRYKALGNSMAVPVMRWIGERIEAVEAIFAAKLEPTA